MISGSLELSGRPSCQAALSFLWTYPHERSCWLTNQLVLQRIGRGWVAAGRVIDRRLLWHSCVVIRCDPAEFTTDSTSAASRPSTRRRTASPGTGSTSSPRSSSLAALSPRTPTSGRGSTDRPEVSRGSPRRCSRRRTPVCRRSSHPPFNLV